VLGQISRLALLRMYKHSDDKEIHMVQIKKVILGSVLLGLIAAGSHSPALALEVGQQAPNFELNSSKGGKLKLSDLRGKNVLINFYRNDFDPT
jgi:cytochrome oxidase Cu insertion factor (SCO1/SenC/PrrC family)